MKRKMLTDRADLLHRSQQNAVDAARAFGKAEGDSMRSRDSVEAARRTLLDAALKYGLACKRYLGGRE